MGLSIENILLLNLDCHSKERFLRALKGIGNKLFFISNSALDELVQNFSVEDGIVSITLFYAVSLEVFVLRLSRGGGRARVFPVLSLASSTMEVSIWVGLELMTCLWWLEIPSPGKLAARVVYPLPLPPIPWSKGSRRRQGSCKGLGCGGGWLGRRGEGRMFLSA